MTIYILHFEPSYKHASHYIGYTNATNPTFRIQQHIKGNGSPLVKAAVEFGCDIQLALTFKANRTSERNLKNRKDVSKWCPLCKRFERPIPKI